MTLIRRLRGPPRSTQWQYGACLIIFQASGHDFLMSALGKPQCRIRSVDDRLQRADPAGGLRCINLRCCVASDDRSEPEEVISILCWMRSLRENYGMSEICHAAPRREKMVIGAVCGMAQTLNLQVTEIARIRCPRFNSRYALLFDFITFWIFRLIESKNSSKSSASDDALVSKQRNAMRSGPNFLVLITQKKVRSGL